MITLLLLTYFNFALAETTLYLGKGQIYELKAPAGQHVYNSNSKVIKVRDSNGKLILNGRGLGQANLTVGNRLYRVEVLAEKQFKSFSQLETKVNKFEGLRLQNKSGRVVISGELLRFSDWKKIAELTREEDLEYDFQAKIGQDVLIEATHHFQQLARDWLLPEPHFSLSTSAMIVLGSEQASQLGLYEKLYKPFGFVIQTSSSGLVLEPSVGVKIFVTEVRKKFLRRIGLRWPSQHQATLLPTATADPTQAIVNIEALEQDGNGKILASPYLICRSGKEAKFLAGGEIPIKVTGHRNSQVLWKQYGVLLNVKPKADSSGRMSLHLTTEVSMIDTSQTIDGVPGMLSNRIETHFDLKKSQTIALSGLIKRQEGKSKEGLPFLSQIPVLGTLFSSQEYLNDETELMIFVTPQVLND